MLRICITAVLVLILIFSPIFYQHDTLQAANAIDEYIIKIPDTTVQHLRFSATTSISQHLAKLLSLPPESTLKPVFKNAPPELSGWYMLNKSRWQQTDLAHLQSDRKIIHYQKNNHLRIQDIQPDDSLYSEQWYHHKVKAYEAWRYLHSSGEIILAVIDTGIDYHHPDLQGSLWVNNREDLNDNGQLDSLDINYRDDDGNGYIDDVIGWDFTDAPRFPDAGDYIGPDNDPMDEFASGHGTQIAGIIAAQPQNGMGIAGLIPGLKVMNLRAGTARGYLEEDDVARAILYAINNGVRIINMSFGDIVVSRFLADVIQYAYAKNAIMVAAAGNSGTNESHYPSGFPETIAVGASDKEDRVAGFSSWGQTLDLVAPGVEIIAPKIGGGYNLVQGTSFSTPMVAAGVAMLLSLHPDYSNEQVRNSIKTSCDDIEARAWDELSGSGRLNLLNLSQIPFQSSLKIHHPLSGESSAEDSESIVITAQDPDLNSITLQYGIGNNPSQWNDIVSDYPYQVIQDTMATLDLSALSDTIIVLRLISLTWTGKTSEYRSLLYLDKSPPEIANMQKTNLYDKNYTAVLFSFQTDDITRGEFCYRSRGSGESFHRKSLNYETRNHKILFNAEQVPGITEFYIELTNLSGLKYIDNNDGNYFQFALNPNPVKQIDFYPVEWTLPAGYMLPYATDFNGNGKYEVVLSRYDANNAFGNIQIYEFDGNRFSLVMTTDMRAIPRSTGDSDSDGKKELLIGYGRKSYLLETDQAQEFPANIIWQDTSNFWASQITDLDKDGNGEIIGRVEKDYKILECTADNSYTERFSFKNTSQGENNLGPPKTVICDLDGDGYLEFVFADYDGDVNIYENSNNDDYQWRYTTRLAFDDATDYLVTAPFFAGKPPALIAGCHVAEDLKYEHEADARYWQFSVINAMEDDIYTINQKINIFGYADIKEFDSGINAAHVQEGNGDFLFVATYPGLYIFKAQSDTLMPFYYFEGVQSNTVLIHDFDKDGSSEFYFNQGEKIIGFEWPTQMRPMSPQNFYAYPVDTVAIELNWKPDDSADKFILYRGRSTHDLMRYDSTQNTSFYTDYQVRRDSTYYYAIQTIDYSYENPFSFLSAIIPAKPNTPPRVDSLVVENERQCSIYFTESMNRETLVIENFCIEPDNKLSSSVVPFLNDRAVLVSFADVFMEQQLMRLKLTNIRDADNTLLDEGSRLLEFIYSTNGDKPYLQQWYLVDRYTLVLDFNMPMDTASVLNPFNYLLEPSGNVENVERIDSSDRKFKVNLSYDTFAGATGVACYLICNNLKNIQGRIFNQGNRINLLQMPHNLAEMIVYPQPASLNCDGIMFANTTPQTEIQIFDIGGHLVAKVKEGEYKGGLYWDLTNLNGQKVAAGIYLYRAVSDKETKMGKLSVLR